MGDHVDEAGVSNEHEMRLYDECVDVGVGDVWLSADGGCQVDNGGCDHLCITGTDGHFYCRCHPGFTLSNDARTCQGTRRRPSITSVDSL